jgi:glycosyltransferase involved in cell wall biosynthesis
MSSFPLVSIVTPSYNQAAFLEKTIRSVLDQDYPNIEYLIADGGSSDSSVEIIQKYSSKLAWWVSEKDAGQADAINKGFKRVKGEFVAWINSDDYYMPGAIRSAVEELQKNKQLGFVYGNVRVVDPEQNIVNNLAYGNWALQDLMSFKIIGQPAVFMRKSVLDKAGYLDPSFHFMLDHHLWLRMARISEIRYIPQLWASAHYHEGCKNLAQAAEFGKDGLRIAEWMRSDPSYAVFFEQNKKKIMAGVQRLNGFYLLDAKEYRKSFAAYWKSFILNPATVRPEWYRMVYAFFAPLGLGKLKDRYLENRRKRLNRQPG